MIRYFEKGPKPTWNWTGRVSWDSETLETVHHSDWPKVFPYSYAHHPLDTAMALVKVGAWKEIVDPDLVMDEGL